MVRVLSNKVVVTLLPETWYAACLTHTCVTYSTVSVLRSPWVDVTVSWPTVSAHAVLDIVTKVIDLSNSVCCNRRFIVVLLVPSATLRLRCSMHWNALPG